MIPLMVLLVLWVWVFYAEGAYKGGPSGKSFEADLAMFYSAAQVMRDGGNPYDHTLLYRTERAVMHRQGLPVTPKVAVVRVGNPPLFLWALGPLMRLPFQTVGYVWFALMYLVSLAGFLATLRLLGWRRTVLPSVVFLMMPAVLLGAFYGNPVAVVFAAVSFALLIAQRYPLAAGALLCFAWLKPPVGLPVVLLILLFHVPQWRKVAAGFAGTTVVLLGLMLLTTGASSLSLWIHGLVGYSNDMGIQPDVASLAGLYVRWAPQGARLVIESLVLILAAGLTFRTWRRVGPDRPVAPQRVAWLWIVWMLATPYAHYFDEILLVMPILTLLGRDGEWLTTRPAVIGLYLSFLSLGFVEAVILDSNVLSLFLLATLACMLRSGERARADVDRFAAA